MLPSLVARDVAEGLKSYIRCEFPVATDGFLDENGRSFLDEFIDQPYSMVKGPWVEVKLPFRQSGEDASLPFTHLPMGQLIQGFNPYQHQRKAFERLAWQTAKSTIVATGTGSGKTECFLFPILDYCLANRKPGIKAILIYPMNALATDQAKRVMALINKITGTRLRAGIYTGESSNSSKVSTPAGEIISNRYELCSNPPDILLTNYKMLDFLLMRPDDQGLWKGNGPDVLRYLVVDELHTFDGAQGTDLACLIRRLRDRLHLTDSLACVGTSATIGGQDSIAALCNYASSVFGTNITPESVIEEDRLSPMEYLESFGDLAPDGQWPTQEILSYEQDMTPKRYFSMVVPLWFNGDDLGFMFDTTNEARKRLGERLPALEGFKRLVRDVRGVTDLDELAKKWAREIADIHDAASNDEERLKLARAIIESLVAMVAIARKDFKGRLVPFLNVRSQLWIRTLSRAVVSVSAHPKLALAADLPSLTQPLYLPVVGCRSCNNVAWATSITGGPKGSSVAVKPDLKLFYESWFSGHRDTVLMYPVTDGRFFDEHRAEMYRICPHCGSLLSAAANDWAHTAKGTEHTCHCGCTDTVLVWIPNTNQEHQVNGAKTQNFVNVCPHCQAKGGLRIFGAASSSLSAATIDHLHASRFNGDDKIIAFSDSVQDAALRAGFMSARNYIPTCRHALMTFLKSVGDSGEMRFKEVLQRLKVFWFNRFRENYAGQQNQDILAKAAFLATFIPPDKEWRSAWKIFSNAAQESTVEKAIDGTQIIKAGALAESFPYWERLYEDTAERLAWEAMMELGYRSENGRTVTRSELAVLTPNLQMVKTASKLLVDTLEEKFQVKTTPERLQPYLMGILHEMRMQGAFDARDFGKIGLQKIADSFGEYLRTGNDFLYNRSPVLPTFGKIYRAPTPLTLLPFTKDSFNIPLIKSGRDTWYMMWAKKMLVNDNVLMGSEIQDLLLATMDALEKAKLVNKIDRPDHKCAWAMPIESWNVSRTVRRWRCNCCGRIYFTNFSGADPFWRGVPCHSPDCHGTLEGLDTSNKNPFYLAPPVRINAQEHTALIESDTRKTIENSFGMTHFPWSVNMLSATSTLEMGIDIGDLSTVLLCSMPPGQANYLQRIGRAGRRDGNAIAITMVGKSAHSQYFWQEPKEMLEGEVSTPGVFLRAVSVLERQLVAFALGRWVSTTLPMPKLPPNLKAALANLATNKADAFPQNFLTWVGEHQEELYHGFIRLFDNDIRQELTEDTREGLKRFLAGSTGEDGRLGLVERISEALKGAREDLESQQRTIKDLTKVANTLAAKQPETQRDEYTQNELEAIRSQKEAMQSLMIRSFDKKPLFNFFTDEGLLPNYAFPEEGVQVNSVIIKRRAKKSDGADDADNNKPRVDTFEFSRAAGQALKELAPNSQFYAQGHILHVDQLNLTKENFEQWRFCPECAHAERVDLTKPTPQECPRCGNPFFGDNGRVKTLLRVRELTATADGKLDRIGDEKEERSSDWMVSHILIDVGSKDVQTAWKVNDDRFTFGFEFLKHVTIREVNFGSMMSGVANSSPFRVAGKNFPQFGFKVCKECGKVHKPFYRAGDMKHDYNCSYYDKPEDPNDDPFIDGLFLYREMSSEAIRIRVPVCDMVDEAGADVGTQSLIAAIRLGLRRYFKGSVDHLAVSIQTEPPKNAAGGDRGSNRYIVIYDTIPGGSGYLKDLGRLDHKSGKPEVMQSMLRAAWEAVSTCDCAKDPEKDGCYHCVYQYRDFGGREQISRKEAESILRRIASYKPEDIQVISSVRELDQLGSSVLENLMLKRLASVPGISFTNRPSKNGELCYEIVVPLTQEARDAWEAATGKDPGERFTWVMTAQTDFTDGSAQSRPDFMIAPRLETLAAKYPELTSYIFTDGWEFHAPKETIEDDARKRQNILNFRHRVWSLTWQDLAATGKLAAAGAGSKLFQPQGVKTAETFWKAAFAAKYPAAPEGKNYGAWMVEKYLYSGASNFDWLQAWLANPYGFSKDMEAAVRYALLTSTPIKGQPSQQARDDYPVPIFSGQDTSNVKGWLKAGTQVPFLLVTSLHQVGPRELTLSAAMRLDERPFTGSRLIDNEELHRQWATFWQSANALQFIENAWVCTRSNEFDAVYSADARAKKVMEVVKPSVSVDINTNAEWGELATDMQDDAEFFANLLPIVNELMREHFAPADDIVDGFGNRVVSTGQGLVWEVGNRSIYLFAKEDLLAPLEVINTEECLVLTTDNPRWKEALAKALGQH